MIVIIMIVAADKALKSRFNAFFGTLGYTAVQYTHPLKAIDNFEELSPDVLICAATDYPRHWKLIVKELRDIRERSETVVILNVDDRFDTEEVDKAAFLRVNALYPHKMESTEDLRQLDHLIRRYKTPLEHPDFHNTWVPSDADRVSFMINHPLDFHIVSGKLIGLSPAGGIFRPDEPQDIAELEPGMLIESASMRVGDTLLDLRARIISNTDSLSLVFIDFADDGFMNLLHEVNRRLATV